ncbi:MAG: molybdopterin-containing oxidoreductase family protein [Thermoleophilia bacterium]
MNHRTGGFTMPREWSREENGVRVVRSIARSAPGCHEGCGVLLHVKDGELVKVEGNPDFPHNHGRLCPRCLAITEVLYHPDRLRYPLKRAGERGEGRWERISWDEAYGTIADRWNRIKQEDGPESVVFFRGTGRDIGSYISRLAYSFGSPNLADFAPMDGHACHRPRTITMRALLGNYAVADCAQFVPERMEHPDWRLPRCVVVWGNNPTVTSPDGFMGHWLVECMKRGTELIVIDPRRTWLASRAKLWLQIRPGTDNALAMGMLNVIIQERLYDEEFVQRWTHGFDALRERVREYTPERVGEITWLPPEQVVEAARMYAASKPAAIQLGVAIEQNKECVTTLHSLIALWSITGNLDVPGGQAIRSRLFGFHKTVNLWGTEWLTEEMRRKQVGAGMYPFLDWADSPPNDVVMNQIVSGRPYPLRAGWFQTTNSFACGAADPRAVYAALKQLEFNVVVDLFMTPTAMALADVVLPAAAYPERDGIAQPGGNGSYLGPINKAVEPVGECKSDMQINPELGKRLNPEAWPWADVREMFSALLQPLGLTFEEFREVGVAYDAMDYRKHEKGLLRADGEPGFETPTGKVELYSTVLEQCGLDPLPYFEEPPESPVSTPDVAEEYPLVLITGARVRGFFHSEHRQIPRLRRMNPDPITEIHPETAAALGIGEGDWVFIESRYGRCRQRARLTPDIHPRVVSSQHAWWFPEKPGPEPSLFGVWESNINLLLPSGWTGRSGLGYPFKNQMCRVYKV